MKQWNEQQRHLQRWLDQELSLDEHRALAHSAQQSPTTSGLATEDQLTRLDHLLKQSFAAQALPSEEVDEHIAAIAAQLTPHRSYRQQNDLRISWPDVGLAACILVLLGANLGMVPDHSWSPLLIGSLVCCVAGIAIVVLMIRRSKQDSQRYLRIPSHGILRLGAWLILLGGATSAIVQAFT